MPSVGNIAEMVAGAGARHVLIEPPRCTQVRHRRVLCSLCVDACPEDAISINDNIITLRTELCTGCGICATVCPTQALRTTGPGTQDILLAIDHLARQGRDEPEPADGNAHHDHLEIACQHALPSSVSARVVVPYITYVDEAVLVHAATAGFSRVSLTCCDRKDCVLPAADLMPQIIEQARTLFSVWGVGCQVKLRRQKPEAAKQADSVRKGAPGAAHGDSLGAGQDYSRRGLLSNVVTQTANLVSETAAAELREHLGVAREAPSLAQVLTDGKGNLLKFDMPRSMQLLDDLFVLNPEPHGTFEARGFCTVSVNASACTRCGICARFCTTGALEGEAAPVGNNHWSGSWANADPWERRAAGQAAGSLTYRISDCVSCGLCEAVCPLHCLSISPQVDASRIFDLEPTDLLA